MSIEKIVTKHGTWELLYNNDGMWQAIPQSLQLPFLEADTIGGVSYKVHTFQPPCVPKDVEIVSALEPTAIRYAANIGTPKKEEKPVEQEKKPFPSVGFPSVGVYWGDYTREEIQEFLDWCVDRGARAYESLTPEEAPANPCYTFSYYSDFSYFGVDIDGKTCVEDAQLHYVTIVNTIKEAKELISKELGLEEPQKSFQAVDARVFVNGEEVWCMKQQQPVKSDEGSSLEEDYACLKAVLDAAYKQASEGKGAERHACSRAFDEQPMQLISELLDNDAGMAFQAIKKIQEARRMDSFERYERELLGAINYIAGMIIHKKKEG